MNDQKKYRHHYVPVGLSSLFCLPGEKGFYMYDLVNKIVVPAVPKDVFVTKGLHDIETEYGVDHNFVEDQLMVFESKGIAAIHKIIESGMNSLIEDEKSWLSNFWALQMSRTPKARSAVEKTLQQSIKNMAHVLDKKDSHYPIPEELKVIGKTHSEIIQKSLIKIKPQATMRSMASIEVLSELLNQMNWCLIKSSEGHFFALADESISVYEPSALQRSHAIDHRNEYIEIVFPISNQYCLLASWQKTPHTVNATLEQTVEINRRSAIFATRFIVHPHNNCILLKFFMRFSSASPEPEVLNEENYKGRNMITKKYGMITPTLEKYYSRCHSLLSGKLAIKEGNHL